MVPASNSLPLILQGPLHSLCVIIGINKATIRGSCDLNPPNGMPTGIVNNKYNPFPVCFLQINVTKRGTTTMCVLCGSLTLASNSKSNVVSIASGE